MAATAARYQTVNTATAVAPGAVALLVKANPKRWYIRIWLSGGAGVTCNVAPGPLATGTTGLPTNPGPVEVHYRDAPAMCTGEWYATGVAGQFFHVWEQLYVGD